MLITLAKSELLQFRNQYTIAKNLDLDGIVKPISLENHRNGYAIVMEDGDLPHIMCFPGQLNQVFMNLIANAIDGLEESN